MPTSTEEIDIAKLLINGRQGRAFRDFDRAAAKNKYELASAAGVYVRHDGTQARLLQVRKLARLQGLPDNFVLPE